MRRMAVGLPGPRLRVPRRTDGRTRGRRGEAKRKARLAALRPAQICSCSVVRAELASGARKSLQVEENLDGIDKLPEPFESVPFDDRAALESAGMPVGANDLLIASIALAGDFVLVTREMREFRRVAGLRPEEW